METVRHTMFVIFILPALLLVRSDFQSATKSLSLSEDPVKV